MKFFKRKAKLLENDRTWRDFFKVCRPTEGVPDKKGPLFN